MAAVHPVAHLSSRQRCAAAARPTVVFAIATDVFTDLETDAFSVLAAELERPVLFDADRAHA